MLQLSKNLEPRLMALQAEQEILYFDKSPIDGTAIKTKEITRARTSAKCPTSINI